MDVFHLGITKKELQGATLAIIPGAPERVEKIAHKMERPQKLASQREFASYLAFIGDVPVVVCSTGIGGPSTSIAIEELAQLGIKQFLRVGTTGAIQPHIEVGDMIVSNASIRLDGASRHFAPLEFPAVSNFHCTQALVNACEKNTANVHIGVTASSDTFYPGQERYDTASGRVLGSLQGSCESWQSMGVLNYEMESATLFTQCASEGLQAGCIVGVILNRHHSEIPDPSMIKAVEDKAITITVEAAKSLLGK